MTDLLDTHPHYLFTYGTLKPGHGNHLLIEKHAGKDIGVAKTVGKFLLIEKHAGKDIGVAKTVGKFLLNEGFPYVWQLPRGLTGAYHAYLGQIIGHLYKVSDAGLEDCDRLEGHPRHYCRTNIPVTFGTDPGVRYATAAIYLAPGELPPFSSLQKPENGLLEWGRSWPEQGRGFQRRQK